MDKSQARLLAHSKRNALPLEARLEAALSLIDNFPNIDVRDKIVGAYWAINSEIDPRPLIAFLKTRGAILALPFTQGETMHFRELNKTSQLIKAGFGTFAPDDTAKISNPDILLTPLLAFNERGYRLGYGKGFYDKYLTQNPCITIGLAHSEQKLEFNEEKHDVCLNYVLTESQILRINQ